MPISKNGTFGVFLMLIVTLTIFSVPGNAAGGRSSEKSVSPQVQPLASTPNELNLNVTLNGAGATFPAPLIFNWTAQYHKSGHGNVTINYASIGSGKGQSAFINKTADFAASDAPLSTSQRILTPGVLHIPETIGSVTASYNLVSAGIRTGLNFTGAVLASIYLGSITMWNDPAIQSLNPGVTLPATAIIPVHRSDSSGTTFIWTSFLCLDSATWCSTVGKGTVVNWPTSTGASGNPGVANYVNNTANSLGYVELNYAFSQGLTYGRIQNPAGNFVLPSELTTTYAVNNSTSNLPQGKGDWSGVSMLNSAGAQTYPIASFTYLLVYQELNVVPSMDRNDKVQAQALISFLNWIITTGQTYSSPLSYVPLPSAVVAIDQVSINSIRYTEVSSSASPTFTLSASATAGWNGINPGPVITVFSGDRVTLQLSSSDSQPHRWYIDINNNRQQDPNETNIQSLTFSTSTPVPYTFIPTVLNQTSLPAAGSYIYRDAINPGINGTIVVLPQQLAAPLIESALTSSLTPTLDSSKVDTIGSLVVDLRTNRASGNITVAAVDKVSGSLTYIKSGGYLLSGLQLSPVSGQLGVQLKFVLNAGVLPYALSSDVSLQLVGTTATLTSVLTRQLDLASQGTINIVDLGPVLSAYGTTRGSSGYNAVADFNADGTINILDVGPFLSWYGSSAFS